MPLNRLLTALVTALGLLVTTVPAGALAGSSEYGRAWRKDGVLRAGCHDYSSSTASSRATCIPGTTGSPSSS